MGDPQAVLLDWPAPAVARLRINRANKRNAIDQSVRQALTDALQVLADQSHARALVFGGVGGVFSAGGDLPSMVGLSEAQARERMQHVQRLCQLVAGLRFPVVSAIEGFGAGAAVGGEEAHRIGLADALAADADVMAHAVQQAQALAALPLDAFAPPLPLAGEDRGEGRADSGP